MFGDLVKTNSNDPGSQSSGGGSVRCSTSWTCTEWSACETGVQVRECVKEKNRCFATDPQPEESQVCSSNGQGTEESPGSTQTQETSNAGGGITGAVIGTIADSGILLTITVIVVLAGLGTGVHLIRKKKKLKSSY